MPYRVLLRLYPRSFRDEFGEDLVEFFDDLSAKRGGATAWRITAIDLLVTVPRYRLEQVMNQHAATSTLYAVIVAFVLAGVASVLTGQYPGMLFFGIALVLAVSQRSALAKAIRVPDSQLRSRRLRIAAVAGAIFVADFALYNAVIGDRWTMRETVLALIGTLCMAVSLCFLVAGLLTRRTPHYDTSLRANSL